MKFVARVFVFCFFLSGWSAASATIIEFEWTLIGGNTYQYDYTITNDTLGFDIEEFTIYFEDSLYENLTSAGASPDWDPLVVEPDSFFGDGFFDVFALGLPLSPGEILGGFSIIFDWLGAGMPGSQSFDVVDPFTFAALDSGTTRAAQPPDPMPVPEPGTLFLLLLGLAVLLFQRKVMLS